MLRKIKENGTIDAIAFPDDGFELLLVLPSLKRRDVAGAEKRYRYLFEKEFPEMEYILCGKKRDPNDPSKRTIVIKDGLCCWMKEYRAQAGGGAQGIR